MFLGCGWWSATDTERPDAGARGRPLSGELDSAMKRAVSWCALFGGIASTYGVGIALMPLTTGLFELEPSRFIADARAANVVQTQLRMADGLSTRTLATSAVAFVLFVAIAYLDWQATKRRAPTT